MIKVQVPHAKGKVITVSAVDSTGWYWNSITNQWEAWLLADIAKYEVVTVEQNGVYLASIPLIFPPAGNTHIVSLFARDASNGEVVANGKIYLDKNGLEITAEEFAALAAAGIAGNVTNIGQGSEPFKYPDGSLAFTSVVNKNTKTRTVTFPPL
jgi:hypothetical protein